jgi:hypothetical protein
MLDTASRVSDEAEAKVAALEPEPPSPEASEAQEPAREKREERESLLSPAVWSTLRKVLPVVWILAAFAAGLLSGAALVCLVLAAGALVLVLTLMWSSVQSLTGTSSIGFEEALGMGAPSRVEEEKRAVLRALKDLEYERGVGKITDEDYQELSARYRAEAKRLMQSLDESLGAARQEVERAIEARLARAGVKAPEPAPGDAAAADGVKAPAEGAKTPEPSEKIAEESAQPKPPEEAS